MPIPLPAPEPHPAASPPGSNQHSAHSPDPGLRLPDGRRITGLPALQVHWRADDLQRLHAFRPTHLLYLHGFRSSPQSAKARCMADWVARHQPGLHWHCPALPASPAQAMAHLADWLQTVPPGRCALMGSSLGGFYADWLARRYDLPAVLINPAVSPARDLAAHIGVHPAWHDPQQRLHFEAAHVAQLQALQDSRGPCDPPVLALIARGDEVLDWREMMARHGQGSHALLEGSDHALREFPLLLPLVRFFLRLDRP